MEEATKQTIETLNTHGIFFHKKCIEAVSKIDTFEVIEKEFPVRLSGQPTKIDIIALRSADHLNYYIIECKKTDNLFKRWIFFPDTKCGTKDKSVINRNGEPPILVDAIVGNPPNLVRYFYSPKNGNGRTISSTVCYDAFEIKIDPKAGPYKNAKKDSIDKACNQVLLGSRAYSLYKSNTDKKDKKSFFIPIVVTTANLKMCVVNTDHIDLKQGIITEKEKVEFIDIDWVIYNYKPNFMLEKENQIPFFSEKLVRNESVDYMMSAYIVNSEKISEFLKEMMWA